MKDEHKRRRKAEQSFVRRLAYGEPRVFLTPRHQECLGAEGKIISSVHTQGGEFVATASTEWWIQVCVLDDLDRHTEYDADSNSTVSDDVFVPGRRGNVLWSACPHEEMQWIFGSVVFIAPDVVACVEADILGRISTWYVRTGQHVESVTLRGVHLDKAMCKISATEFVVGSDEGHLCVLSHERGRNLREAWRVWKAHTSVILSLTCHENRIVSTSEDCTARLWDVDSRKRLAILKHDSHLNSAAISDKYIMTCSKKGALQSTQGELRIYCNKEGFPLAKILRAPDQIDRPTILDDDCVLCIVRGEYDDMGRPLDRNSLALVDIASERMLMEMKVGIRCIVDYSVLPDARLVMVGWNGCRAVVVTPPRRLRNAILVRDKNKQWRSGSQGMCALM